MKNRLASRFHEPRGPSSRGYITWILTGFAGCTGFGEGMGVHEPIKTLALIFSNLRDSHPSPLPLSPLRGEGAAIGNRSYLNVVRHNYDGVRFVGDSSADLRFAPITGHCLATLRVAANGGSEKQAASPQPKLLGVNPVHPVKSGNKPSPKNQSCPLPWSAWRI